VDQISATIDELREAVADYRESADGRRARQLVDSLFRSVHTFKAAAAAEGLSDLNHTAHEFENLLHSVRTGELALDEELLRACAETVVALREGSPAPSFRRLTDQPKRNQTGVDDLPHDFAASLKEDERHRAVAAIRDGANLYVLKAVFEVADFDERFRQLKEQLDKTTEIISISPALGNDQIIFQVVYASESERIPFQTAVRQAIRAGQATAAALGKQIEFVVKSNELLLEKSVADVLADALLHLVRNAVDHGIESRGRVTLATQTTGGTTRFFVTDNGRGIDAAHLPRLFEPGFSTASEVSEMSGRGVGLDAVKTAVEAVGGSVNVVSYPGQFTSFVLSFPNPSSDA